MIAFISSVLEEPCDQEYILSIYEKYDRLMYSTAQKHMSGKADCDDLVQECILKMIEKIDCIRELDGCVLPAYIVSIIRNTAANHIRRQAVSQKHLAAIASRQAAEPFEPDELSHLLFCKETLSGVMALLTPDERLLLEGKYLLGYSDRDLARYLKCKPNSVRMKLTRARRRAIQLISQQEDENDDQKGKTSREL